MSLSITDIAPFEELLERGLADKALEYLDSLLPEEDSGNELLLLKVRALSTLFKFDEIEQLTRNILAAQEHTIVEFLFFRAQSLLQLRQMDEFNTLVVFLENSDILYVRDSGLHLRVRNMSVEEGLLYLESNRERWGPKCTVWFSRLLIEKLRYDDANEIVREYQARYPIYVHEFEHLQAEVAWRKDQSRSNFEALVCTTYKLVDHVPAFLYCANLLLNRRRTSEAADMIAAALRCYPFAIPTLRMKMRQLLMDFKFSEWNRVREQVRQLELASRS